MISEPAAALVFVGREAELAQLARAFEEGARAVVLTGPPGVGKTRLVARLVELEGAAMRAAIVADLASTRTAEALVAALGAALDLRADAGPPPDRARVAAALDASSPRLVVLDNAEGLDPGARALLQSIVAATAPGARIVATSRERLGFGAEAAIEIGGLSIDEGGDGVALLRERARAVGAPLTTDDAGAALAIVAALDGNPLAIELAAAQLDVLSPGEIRERLARRLDLSSDAAQRGRYPTLRAAIAASWESLDATLMLVLARVSVMSGEMSADAAEAVVGDPSVDVVAALRRLRDRSLVSVRRTAITEGSGKNRLRLDSSVRAYAREQLEVDADRDATTARHAAWFVTRATAHAAALRRRGEREARAWLLDEQDELVAIARGSDAKSALAAAIALAPLWERTGRCGELIEVLDAASARGGTPGGDDALAVAIARGQALGLSGRLVEARDVLDRAIDGGSATRAPDLVGEALTHLMVRRRQLGDVEGAIAAGERAFEILDEKEAPHLCAANAACLGLTLAEIGRPDEARRHDEAARDTFRALGDRWGEGLVLGNLAQLAQGEGDLETAMFFVEATIEAFRASRDPLYEGVYTGIRAGIAGEAGAPQDARRDYDRSIALLVAGGMRHVEGVFRAQRAALLASMGEHGEARTELDVAGSLLRAAGAPAYLALLELHTRVVELARLRGAFSPADGDRTAAAEEAVRRALEETDALPAAKRSQFVAFAARTARAAVAKTIEPGRTLVVGPDAGWFAVPPATPTSLSRRAAPRRLLGALVAARGAGALGVDALFAAGWPGERAIPTARANRVRVAIATLRALGLEGLVVTRDAGYALASEVDVRDDPRSDPSFGRRESR